MGVARVTLPIFKILASLHMFRIGEATHFKLRVLRTTSA